MYTNKICSKVDKMFDELNNKVEVLVREASTSSEAIDKVTKIVSSELSTRSKSIISDMLFDLSDSVMNTDFYKDNISRQNQFSTINLRQEILSKYQFTPSTKVDYEEASSTIESLAISGGILVVGGAIEIGTVLIKGLSFSSLIPIPIGVLIVASIGTAIANYFAIAPSKSKKQMIAAIKNYLINAKKQFLDWFDEVEKYFNMRVEEIEKTM